jgi:hypothetical protein
LPSILLYEVGTVNPHERVSTTKWKSTFWKSDRECRFKRKTKA